MNPRVTIRAICIASLLAASAPVLATAQKNTRAVSNAPVPGKIRVTGVVRDEFNAISLPGVPVAVVGTADIAYTDVDGRYRLELAPGSYELKVTLDGYQDRTVKVDVVGTRAMTVDIGISMAKFADTVTVTAEAPLDALTSTAEAQLVERKNANVITDNMGAQEMRANGDSDAASAMQRVTGLSVVDNQYVFVRGLGERYSNTTLSGSTLPTTELDKKVVPLDLFPSGLLDSIQVNKSYSPDRSAEFAGGLVQIIPLKLPARPVVDFSYGVSHYSTSTGKSIPLSPLGKRDWIGFDDGARALPNGIPSSKIVRRGVYTPDVGYSPEEITAYGRAFDTSRWSPVLADGAPGQNWGAVFGNRFGKLGVIGSVMHSYKEQYVEETRAFYRVAEGTELEPVSLYDMQTGTQRAQLGIVGNVAYEFTTNHRFSVENFYSHSGRNEGRFFQGANTDNNFWYDNSRLQFIEEGLLSNAASGEHFFQGLANSRIDWRASFAQANRDEPDLREVLYQSALIRNADGTFGTTGTKVLADESQSGFRLFNQLDDQTVDVAANWSVFRTAGSRPTQVKFGVNYVERTRDFQSRRFRYIPIVLTKDGAPIVSPSLLADQLYATSNIGTAFRFNEETRPTDAYDGEQKTAAGYGMIDIALASRSRLVVGARVERFDQIVNTFDPFGLFQRTIQSENKNTDVFPAVNFVQNLRSNTNLRVGYSATVNRPEFRELAAFEFTDVVGNRAVRGNPDLDRAIIQNVDARWEMFPGGRGVLAASLFYKHFDQPIERVVVSGVQPLVTFQNADRARNFGFEFEAGHKVVEPLFVSVNYTFVDSQITLRPEQQTVQTSLERPLAGQSKNLFNVAAEFTVRGFSARVLGNYFGDRISDVGANQAPDVIEQGRGTLDMVFGQRLGRVNVRLSLDNITDAKFRFTQGNEDQRLFALGRTIQLSFGLNVF